MAQTILTGAYNLQTPEHGKFVKLDTASLTAEMGSVDAGFDPNYPKYAVLTYNVGESPSVSATNADAVRGTDVEMYQDALLSLGTSTTYTLSSSYIDDNVESAIFTLISNSGTFCRLNFSDGLSSNSATFGIKFSVDDTIRIDGSDALNKLTFATDGNLSVYASFIRYN
jgi:hypothetical protein